MWLNSIAKRPKGDDKTPPRSAESLHLFSPMTGALLLRLCILIDSAFAHAEHAPPLTPDGSSSHQPAPIIVAEPLECSGVITYEAEIEKILLKGYRPFLQKTERTVVFYHWGWRTPRFPQGVPPGKHDDSTPVASSSNATDYDGPFDNNQKMLVDGKMVRIAEQYFKKKASDHFAGPPSGEYGGGTYAAVDPIGSINYAGDKPLMLRVEVPENTKYLDLRKISKSIPVSKDEMRKTSCYLFEDCTSQECEAGIRASWKNNIESNRLSFYLKDFLQNGQRQTLAKRVFKKLEASFITANWSSFTFPECKKWPNQISMPDAIFVDPDVSSRFRTDILVQSLEANAPAEKRKLYEEVLAFFDAYEVTAQRKVDGPRSVARFYEFYRGWASSLRNLPANTDIEAYHKEQNQKWRDQDERSRRLSSRIFGCSNEFPSETGDVQ